MGWLYGDGLYKINLDPLFFLIFLLTLQIIFSMKHDILNESLSML